eukprot:TRINITY_DN10364_c0_g2_i1.p1 TRINITY_DN10364_c0_g2~~TRINITY_DN10364_c0_g2_i1.p1  ORF type:complete len:535 (-),score=80.03 TRINITY_DN10364_c0_g2_i1:115-1599(-)
MPAVPPTAPPMPSFAGRAPPAPPPMPALPCSFSSTNSGEGQDHDGDARNSAAADCVRDASLTEEGFVVGGNSFARQSELVEAVVDADALAYEVERQLYELRTRVSMAVADDLRSSMEELRAYLSIDGGPDVGRLRRMTADVRELSGEIATRVECMDSADVPDKDGLCTALSAGMLSDTYGIGFSLVRKMGLGANNAGCGKHGQGIATPVHATFKTRRNGAKFGIGAEMQSGDVDEPPPSSSKEGEAKSSTVMAPKTFLKSQDQQPGIITGKDIAIKGFQEGMSPAQSMGSNAQPMISSLGLKHTQSAIPRWNGDRPGGLAANDNVAIAIGSDGDVGHRRAQSHFVCAAASSPTAGGTFASLDGSGSNNSSSSSRSSGGRNGRISLCAVSTAEFRGVAVPPRRPPQKSRGAGGEAGQSRERSPRRLVTSSLSHGISPGKLDWGALAQSSGRRPESWKPEAGVSSSGCPSALNCDKKPGLPTFAALRCAWRSEHSN